MKGDQEKTTLKKPSLIRVSDLQNRNFFSFMTKVKPNNENERKSDIFPWNILKSDAIYFFIEK